MYNTVICSVYTFIEYAAHRCCIAAVLQPDEGDVVCHKMGRLSGSCSIDDGRQICRNQLQLSEIANTFST